MLKKFKNLCEKRWETNCLNDFKCVDGEAIKLCYANLNLDNYAIMTPLNKVRDRLEIPFQTAYRGNYLWRAFSSRTYRADSRWWGFTNNACSIYCTKTRKIGDLCIKFGFGDLIADQSVKSVVLDFLRSIDKSDIATVLDPTDIYAGKITFQGHDAKTLGGVTRVVERMQEQLVSSFASINIDIEVEDWIMPPVACYCGVSIPFEFQDAS